MKDWITIGLTGLCFSLCLVGAGGYACVERCEFDSPARTVAHHHLGDTCLVSIPDNPAQLERNITFPCKLEVFANCSRHCFIKLTFAKFNLPTCQENITSTSNLIHTCDHLHKCEYVVLTESGEDKDGNKIEEVVDFHGQMTDQVFISRTDRVTLHFCYKRDTFSARNIHIEYVSYDPQSIPTEPFIPLSVAVILIIVFLLCMGIFVVQFCPWLRPCLDPKSNRRPNYEL